MDNMLTLGIILTAKDAFSPAFSKMGNTFSKLTKDSKTLSTGLVGIGTALKGVHLATQGGAETVIKSFVDLEDAQIRLKSTLMKSDGSVSPFFKSINDEAITLGNKLPGTTADFLQMAASMKSLGVEEKSIAGGALKSAAYLGAVLKIPYDEASESVAKFKQSLGIADSDLLPFIDDIQRMGNMGVKVSEMSFAFAKVGATMKGIGRSGLKASREIEPLVGMLIQNNFSGETVGTNLGNIIKDALSFKGSKELDAIGIKLNFNDAKGNFKGPANMIKELEKLKAIKSDAARLSAIEAIFGKGEASGMAMVLINKGTKGLDEFNKKMEEQADINARVKAASEGLGMMWESMTGTFTNFLAIVGKSFAPEMKAVTNIFSDISTKLSVFSEEHPNFAKFLGAIALGVPIITGILGTIGIAVGAFIVALGLIGITTLPIFGSVILIIGGLALAGYALVSTWEETYWGWVVIWDRIKATASSAWEGVKTLFGWTPIGMIINNWTSIVGVFKTIIGMITKPFSEFFTWIESKFNFVSEGVSGIGSLFGVSGPTPTPSRVPANPRVASARDAVAHRTVNSREINTTHNTTNSFVINGVNGDPKAFAVEASKHLAKMERDKNDKSYKDRS